MADLNLTCLSPESKQYWAVPYKSNCDNLNYVENLTLADVTGRKNCIIDLNKSGLGPHRKESLTFERCWFRGELSDLNISNWAFKECTFDDSHFTRVKFTNCSFERCHFHKTTFQECAFMDTCNYISCSASAETLYLKDTMLNASEFLAGLTTNLGHLPEGVSPDYQSYRLKKTKSRLAVLIYASTRNEPNIEFYDSAQQALVVEKYNWIIEECRWFQNKSNNQLCLRGKRSAFFRSLPARFEILILHLAGEMTRWGHSILVPSLVLLVVTFVFALLYLVLGFHGSPAPFNFGDAAIRSLIKSANISLVAGYTAYFKSDNSITQQIVELLNLLLGLFWYSLVVPVLARRIFR